MQKKHKFSKTFTSMSLTTLLLAFVGVGANETSLMAQDPALTTAVDASAATGELLAIVPEASCEFKAAPEFQGKDPDKRPVVTTIAVSRDANFIYAGGDDEYVYQIDRSQTTTPEDKKGLLEFKANRIFGRMNDWVRAVAVDPVSNNVVVMSQSGQLIMYDLQTKKSVNRSDKKIVGAHDLAYAPNGRVIAVCGYNENVYMFDSQTLKPIVTWDAPGQSSTTIKFSNNGELFALGGRSGVVNVWTTKDGSLFRKFDLKDEKSEINRRVRAVAFNEDDSLLAIAGDSQLVYVFDVKTGAEKARLKLDSGKVFSASFLGKNILATGNSQNKILIWDVAQSKQIGSGSYHSGTVASMVYVPQSESNPKPFLVSSGFDAKIVVWDLNEIKDYLK